MTSFAILARVPPTSAYAQTASATPSRAVCHAISGTARPRSAQKSAWSSRPFSPIDASVPTAPASWPRKTRGASWASRSRCRSISATHTATL